MPTLILRYVPLLGCIGLSFVATSAKSHNDLTGDLAPVVAMAAQKAQASAFLDVQGCGLSFSAVSGVANRKTGAAAALDMPLRLGSVGKLYTAAVIHRLAARGVLSLDAPVSRYLLASDAIGVANRDATLRQLLNHTSGVPDYYALPEIRRWNWKKPLTPLRVMTAIKGRRATTAPGVSYSYSNSGYHLLALAAERATGRSFAELMRTEVISPLNLRETHYNVSAPGGSLHGYVGRKDWWESAENTGPDSGVTATLADVRAYLRALLIDEGPIYGVGQAMIEDPVESGKPRQQAGAGAELRTTRDGMQLVGHTGDVEGYLSFAYAVPAHGLTMVGHMTASDKESFATLLRMTVQTATTACRRYNAK